MMRVLAMAFALPLGSAVLFFGGDSLGECQKQCLAKDVCGGLDACNVSQVCEFQCTCVEQCDVSSEDWSFSLCGDYLKTCFEQAPRKGYAHFTCWSHACGSYYTAVQEERQSGKWEGLGGWELLGVPLPVAASGSERPWRGAVLRVMTGSAMLAGLMLSMLRVALRRRGTYLQVDAGLLELEESSCEE